jgi:hypothetical protein
MARTPGQAKYRTAIRPIRPVIISSLLASSAGGYICGVSICEHVPTCENVHRGLNPQLVMTRMKGFRVRTARRRFNASSLLREAFRCPAALFTLVTVMCSPKARNMSRRRSGINSLFNARHLRFPLQLHKVTYPTRAFGRVSLLPCSHGPVSHDLPGSPNLHKTVP